MNQMDVKIAERVERAARVLREAGAKRVYLFGSAAGGVMRQGSDIDLAVEGLPPGLFYRAVGIAEDAAGLPLDVVDLDEDTPFSRHLVESGELRLV
jgi:predicted nucleotidyltransferase